MSKDVKFPHRKKGQRNDARFYKARKAEQSPLTRVEVDPEVLERAKEAARKRREAPDVSKFPEEG